MRKTIMAAATTAVLTLATSLAVAGDQTLPRKLPIDTIVRGHYAGLDLSLTNPRTFHVDDQTSWQAVWTELTSNQLPTPVAPTIDFATSHVIGVAAAYNTGGFGVNIDEVIETEATQRVVVTITSPGDDCAVTLALTQPHHFVKAPKIEKPIDFQYRSVVRRCDD